MKTYGLRDYMLLKTRKPSPRAIFTDLPTIPYTSKYKFMGFPVLKPITIFTFRLKDVRMIADIVHGDVEGHMRLKRFEKATRQNKARSKRVKELKLRFHEGELKQATGKWVWRHEKGENHRQ